MRPYAGGIVRTTRTPLGPVTAWFRSVGDGLEVEAKAWGAGAGWVIDHAPEMVGALDDDAQLVSMLQTPGIAGGALLRELTRRMPGLRLGRSMMVTEALVPTILEQKVAGVEAYRSYRGLVRAMGHPAPGPPEVSANLMTPPDPRDLAATPYWAFHRFGIERRRADTIRRVSARAAQLDAGAGLSSGDAIDRMTSIVGVGLWTAAEVAMTALGDPDAVSIGDYHLPHQVTWAFTGRRRGDDEIMLKLLEPFRGQRGRVTRLIEAAGIAPPRHGPRQPLRSFREY